MKIFSWGNIQEFLNTGIQNDFFNNATGISIGCFDGVHKGHRVLLETLINKCKAGNLKSGVVTFSRPLPSVKHSHDYKGDISSLDTRLKLIESMGVDFAIVVDFDDEFASQLGVDFLNILVNACNMELLAEGVDFRCGYKGATDAQAIKYFGVKNNIQTIFVEPVYYYIEESDEKERISSSYIRDMISKGFFSTAGELLNRPYEIDLSKCKKIYTKDGFYIEKKDIVQALPPDSIYRVFDEYNREVRLKITSDRLSFKVADGSKEKLERILFK